MDLCQIKGEKPSPMNDKRMVRCHRSHKLGHYAYECSVPRLECAVPSVVFTHQQDELEGEGLLLLQSRNSEMDHQKMDGVSRGGATY